MKEKDIQRINELYNLGKSIGLKPEQKEEPVIIQMRMGMFIPTLIRWKLSMTGMYL